MIAKRSLVFFLAILSIGCNFIATAQALEAKEKCPDGYYKKTG